MSWTVATNSGSLESLNVSAGWPEVKRPPDRPTVDSDSPVRSAIFALDQCVAWSGVDSKVATSTSSTCLAVIVGGRPGRGSSESPSNRNSQNRRRHFPTVPPRVTLLKICPALWT